MKIAFYVAVFTAFTTSGLAGSLTPPGPPAPTMKTLDEVEARTPIHSDDLPLVISESGSYYFAENISVATPDTTGILVAAPNVTIDLNGFSLTGAGENAGTTGDGVHTAVPSDTVVIMNGTIKKWRGRGIDTLASQDAIIEDVIVSNNGGIGIAATTATVRHCIVKNNGNNGISCSRNGSLVNIVDNTSSSNGGAGISAGGVQGIIANNYCRANSHTGIYLFLSAVTVKDNLCEYNTDGIVCSWSHNTVEGNTARSNSHVGINSVHFNNNIFQPADTSLYIRNTATGNPSGDFIFSGFSRAGPVVSLSGGGMISSENPWANISY